MSKKLDRLVAELIEIINEKEQAEEAVRNQERFLDSIFEELPNMVFVKEPAELRFVRFNKAGEELLGVSRHELIGKNDFDLFPAEQARFFVEKDRSVLESRAILDIPEEPIDTQTHGQRILHTKKIGIFDDNDQPLYLLGISEDITERKLAEDQLRRFNTELERQVAERTRELSDREQQLRNQNKLYSDLLETTQEGFWHIDNQGRTIDVNPALCELLGREREEILGKTIYDFVDAQNREIFEHQLRARSHGRRDPYEIALMHSSGVNVACINNATPVYDADGEKTGSIGLWTRVDELKREQFRLELERDAAEQISRAKSAFLSAMSHELRTPLNAIMGFSGIISANFTDDPDNENARFANKIREAGANLSSIVDKVLNFVNLSNGEVAIDPTPVKLAELVERALDSIEFEAKRAGFDFEVYADSLNGVLVAGNAYYLEKCLTIVFENAIKYCPVGSHMTILCEALPENRVRLWMTDNGPGIPRDRIEKAFDMFERLDQASGSVSGLGIGLPIARSYLQAMGAEISIDQDYRDGLRVLIDFNTPR